MEDKKLREDMTNETLRMKHIFEEHQKLLKVHNEVLTELNERIKTLEMGEN